MNITNAKKKWNWRLYGRWIYSKVKACISRKASRRTPSNAAAMMRAIESELQIPSTHGKLNTGDVSVGVVDGDGRQIPVHRVPKPRKSIFAGIRVDWIKALGPSVGLREWVLAERVLVEDVQVPLYCDYTVRQASILQTLMLYGSSSQLNTIFSFTYF